MTQLTLQVCPDYACGTVTVYANEGLDALPYGYLENVLEPLRGVERVKVRRYTIEIDTAIHLTTVYRVGIDVADRLLAETETFALSGYELRVESVSSAPQLGGR